MIKGVTKGESMPPQFYYDLRRDQEVSTLWGEGNIIIMQQKRVQVAFFVSTGRSMTQPPTNTKPTTLTYKGRTVLIVSKIPDTIGLIMPAILPRADAVPTAVPRTSVVNTSGV